jgi:hypothetical protein
MRRQRFRFENRLLRLVREEEDQLIHSVARLVIRLPLPPGVNRAILGTG